MKILSRAKIVRTKFFFIGEIRKLERSRFRRYTIFETCIEQPPWHGTNSPSSESLADTLVICKVSRGPPRCFCTYRFSFLPFPFSPLRPLAWLENHTATGTRSPFWKSFSRTAIVSERPASLCVEIPVVFPGRKVISGEHAGQAFE